MPSVIVGRDAEFDHAWRCLGAPESVLLNGPAGIGKTALWRALVGEAEQAGWLVLACAPTESEMDLPFAALADLLRSLTGQVPRLPAPQRVAAEVVMLSSDTDEPVDERVIAAATRSLLDAAVAGSRVLVAVDDAPWLDRPSERALRFALRRVTPRPAVLVTSRANETGPQIVPLGLDHGLHRIDLEPLGVGALHHILRQRLGATLSRPLLARIAREAGGNPLLAIDLARAVLRLPQPPLPGEDLPVASTMQQLFADTFASLPDATQQAVRLAALLAVPSLSDLALAGVEPAMFDPAEEAGLLSVTPAAVEFAHPVYASTVRTAIPPGVRRRLHRDLAAAVTDPDEKARHLALATVGSDAAIARTVAAVAHRHHARGAPELAAQLYERAAQLTPPEAVDDRARRRLEAARCRYDSGDYAAAGAAAEAVAAEAVAARPPVDSVAAEAVDTAATASADDTVKAGTRESGGQLRAEALLLRAMVAWSADELGDVAPSIATRALAAAPPGSRLAGRIHAYLALFRDAPGPARQDAEAALALLSADGDDRGLLAAAMLQLFFNEVRAGLPPRTELLDRALEMEGGEPLWLAGTIPAIWWRSIDQPEPARARLHRMLERAVARGDEPSQHELLTHLGETELLACCWTAAREHITAALELGQQLGTGLAGESWLAGLLDAYQGELAKASLAAQAGLLRGDEFDDDWCRRIYLQLSGFVALSGGRMAEAAEAYGRLAAMMDRLGLVEPLSLRYEPDWIEACVGAGDLDGARAALRRLAERHQRLPRPWTTLGIARGEALLHSATGIDPDAALEELAAARARVPDGVLPLDRARCLLVEGVVQRRARRKRPAREALTAAAAEFAAIGAAAFVDRARAELARIGVRPAAPLELTATEERVARLAAQGRTNRAIADELFVSPKTVEANLARVYRKLGISTRAELGAAMANRATGTG